MQLFANILTVYHTKFSAKHKIVILQKIFFQNIQNSRNLALGGIFAVGNFVVVRYRENSLIVMMVGHKENLRGKMLAHDWFRTINDEDRSYIRFKIRESNQK